MGKVHGFCVLTSTSVNFRWRDCDRVLPPGTPGFASFKSNFFITKTIMHELLGVSNLLSAIITSLPSQQYRHASKSKENNEISLLLIIYEVKSFSQRK